VISARTFQAWLPTKHSLSRWRAEIQCAHCKQDFMLDAYPIKESGLVMGEVTCTQCGTNNGEIQLIGYPPRVDMTR